MLSYTFRPPYTICTLTYIKKTHKPPRKDLVFFAYGGWEEARTVLSSIWIQWAKNKVFKQSDYSCAILGGGGVTFYNAFPVRF